MSSPLAGGTHRADDANLAGSAFHNVDLSGARYEDVNLRDAVFANVSLTRSRIRNACMGEVSIEDANYTGMRIEGILVTELLRVDREHRPTETGARLREESLATVPPWKGNASGHETRL
jgi:uncharacterized protein YjbI with pentapeptide repeats